jgi:hypothetical protein
VSTRRTTTCSVSCQEWGAWRTPIKSIRGQIYITKRATVPAKQKTQVLYTKYESVDKVPSFIVLN